MFFYSILLIVSLSLSKNKKNYRKKTGKCKKNLGTVWLTIHQFKVITVAKRKWFIILFFSHFFAMKWQVDKQQKVYDLQKWYIRFIIEVVQLNTKTLKGLILIFRRFASNEGNFSFILVTILLDGPVRLTRNIDMPINVI